MILRDQQKIAKILLALSFVWVLNCCSYRHPPIRQAPEEPPKSVEVKTETYTIAPKTSIEPETETRAAVPKRAVKPKTKTQTIVPKTTVKPKTKTQTVVPKTTVKPKTKTYVRVAKIPDKIEPKARFVASETPTLVTPSPKTPESHYYVHKVQWPGETLSSIAKWYTGTVKNWEILAKANPTLNPKKIAIGDTISIPEDLLTSRKPLPRSFARASVRKKGTPPSSSKKKSIQSESPKLFGPIETEQTSVNSNAVELFAPIE